MGQIAATNKPGMRNGVMGGAEGTGADEGNIGWELIADGVYSGDVRGFIDGQMRKDGGQRPCQEGFSSTGGTNHQHDRVEKPSLFPSRLGC